MNHQILYRDQTRYSSFPTVVKGDDDELWVGFDWNAHAPLCRGVAGAVDSHAGGLAGGSTWHVELFSPDSGHSWFEDGADDRYRACPEQLRSAVLWNSALELPARRHMPRSWRPGRGQRRSRTRS